MLTTKQALEKGFEFILDEPEASEELKEALASTGSTAIFGYYTFKFGDGYELCFEPMMWEGQMYVALYKDKELLTEKVVVKPGYIKPESLGNPSSGPE